MSDGQHEVRRRNDVLTLSALITTLQSVERHYDIYEKLPDGALVWLDVVIGLENATLKLKEVAAQTQNEVCVMYIPDKTIIAAMNVPKI